jgi:hypothetical protein
LNPVVIGTRSVSRRGISEASAYVMKAGLAEGYLWHEFGDVHLLLP